MFDFISKRVVKKEKKVLDDYFAIRENVFEYFGYKERARAYPIDDMRDVYWSRDDTHIYWSYKKEHQQQCLKQFHDYQNIPDDDAYSDVLLEGPWISIDGKYTLFLEDTQTDGNVFLRIFDNAKKVG